VKHTIPVALALGCLALEGPARAADPDPWWGRDKALHFSLSIGLGSGGYAGSALWVPERWQRAASGAGFSLSLGAGKELFDLAGYGDPSWRDFTWDVAGTALGVGAAYLLDLAFFPRTKRQAVARCEPGQQGGYWDAPPAPAAPPPQAQSQTVGTVGSPNSHSANPSLPMAMQLSTFSSVMSPARSFQ
jgi:putative lipoprotein